jgi:O-antigen/teichoic acid export membrane protein
MKGMNRKISVGVLWNLASLFLTRGASTVFMLFLARLLAPEAFGLIAMATVVFELAGVLINSGLGQALIRSKEVSDIDLSTVFLTNLALSLLAFSAIFASAPFVASFYSQPELTALIRVMGLVVFINAAKLVQTAVLTRRMDFKSQMKANAVGTGMSGVLAVTAAYSGWGVWSLVVQMLSQAVISAAVLWWASSWRPNWAFSRESFSRLFAFGRSLLAEGLLQVAFLNSYILVIGRFFSAELTGLYYFAQKLSNLVSKQLTGAVQQATFPALATLQEDNEALKLKYRQIMQLTMFLIAPIMAFLAALAYPLISLIFDERWLAAVPYLQLLCVVGMFFPLHSLNMNLLNVKGRSDLVFKIGLVKKSVNLALLFLAVPYGVFGIVVSQVIATFLALIPNTYFAARLVGYSLFEQVKDILKPLFSALVVGFVSWIFVGQGDECSFLGLGAAGAIGILGYLVLSFVVKAEGSSMLFAKAKTMMDQRFERRNYK